jgi:hypothetical protein
MTLIYSQTGQVKMFCDVCEKVTDFYDTLDELMAAVHFNLPLTAENPGWCFGPGKKIIGGGFQPITTVDTKKHACFNCRGCFETLSYKSDWAPHKYDGKVGKVGDPAKTSRDEDQKMNQQVDPLFTQGTPVSNVPRVFPRDEPEFTRDSHYNPYGDQEEAS